MAIDGLFVSFRLAELELAVRLKRPAVRGVGELAVEEAADDAWDAAEGSREDWAVEAAREGAREKR